MGDEREGPSRPKVALVTGASRGIGRAIALRLGAEGMRVVVNYHARAEAAEEVVAAVGAGGSEALAVQADVADPAQAGGLVDSAIERFGALDVVVHNAGTTRDNLLARMSDEEIDSVLDTNLKSAFHVIRPAVRTMMRQRAGRIVCIASIAGVDGNPGQTNYAASKAGLIGLVRSLAKEIGPRGITVNAVAPGYIATDMTAQVQSSLLDRAVEHTPLRRIGTVDDVASAVAFLVSDEAAFITGQVVRVDGGLHL